MSDPPDIDPAHTVDPGAADISTPDTLSTHQKDPNPMADQTEKGTTELKEAITGAVEVVEAAIRAGADGWQVTDAQVVIIDHDMRQAARKALEGASEIPSEVADLSFAEGADVAAHAVSEVRDILS
jgi:hypothetical protein